MRRSRADLPPSPRRQTIIQASLGRKWLEGRYGRKANTPGQRDGHIGLWLSRALRQPLQVEAHERDVARYVAMAWQAN